MATSCVSIKVNPVLGRKAHVCFDSRRQEYSVLCYARNAPGAGWKLESTIHTGEEKEDAMDEAGEWCPQGEWQ